MIADNEPEKKVTQEEHDQKSRAMTHYCKRCDKQMKFSFIWGRHDTDRELNIRTKRCTYCGHRIQTHEIDVDPDYWAEMM